MYSLSTYLYSLSPPKLRRMKITPERRNIEPIGGKAMLMPPNTCAGGSRFSCSATVSTAESRFERCDHNITAGWFSRARRIAST